MKLITLLSLFFSLTCLGQTLSRQSISSTGNGQAIDGVTFQQIIGQPYQTQTQRSGNIVFRPGFEQPVFSSELISSTIHVVIAPNPALFSFYVETSDTLFNTVLTISDTRGRVICTENIEVLKKHETQCASWANGIYIVNITDQKNNHISAKVIKHE